MATILHGLFETKSHAPLSSGQTIAVFQHLHNQQLNAFQQIDDLRGILDQKGKRQPGALEKLKTSVQTIREDINLLREGQKKTNTNVDSVREDLKLRSTDIKALRVDVDDVLKVAVGDLEEKVNSTMLKLKQVDLEHEKSKQELSIHKSRLQALNEDRKSMNCSLQKLDSAVGKQASTLADTCTKLDAQKTNLEITNAVVLKMNESREASMNDITNLKEGVRATDKKIDGLQLEHVKIAKEVGTAREELANAVGVVELTRQGLNKAMDQVTAVRQSQQKSAASVDKLSNDLAKVRNLADSTQQHLEVTNSMVLPNLASGDVPPIGFQSSMEGSRSLGGTALSGPGLGGTGLGRTGSLTTPRKRRESTWNARNIGAVPDRMSW
eukprot:CAMPEP_0179017324 /NCGR_PEP_ID=MMETSP0796-20121207/3779_1 /TAXON_ID=73915 /ORGANISM="Pyrodinium bahamense, Strain pbaha01" /LENGTH=381 /DNA_ID=CAMNT_0020713047 /DNA_START=25 /DNA_END=1168 /DNA_ORIENTATION=+